ncbi:AfsR/SARP family transcriptional regulator [Herbihabitans rhizosphaerae]|uniref:AfsR/SARP family transcriptional regulator n=1 Tax=Herbihabitans rhizosphaerae TaxID=1872711 RepID=UPI00102C3ACB|nr:DUF3856 domain-containing protein [Herbihabitans rhizosphaerae]
MTEADGRRRLRVRLLGPFEVRLGGEPIVVSGPKQRILLAALALFAGRDVPVDTLARAVWGERTPSRAKASVQTHVMRLRQQVGDGAISTGRDGYRLAADPDDVDVTRFAALLRRAAAEGDPAVERALLGEALALWQGEPLQSVRSDVLLDEHVPQLVESHLVAVERRVDLDLDLGEVDGVAGELTELLVRHPLREPLWERLMRVLAASGRTAEALAVYADCRERFADELGVDPGERLRALHLELLNAVPPDDAGEAAEPPALVPRQLPHDTTRFTARGAELAELDRLLEQAQPDATAIVLIDGTAGVGKTSLAVHWAHRIAGRYPDGQFFLDMRGHSGDAPVPPEAALDTLLRAAGVRPDLIPSTVEGRSAMLRTRFAGTRTILMLDNVATAGQVRPLFGGPGQLVVITSRNQLRGLVARDGARRLSVREFSAAAAACLLAASAGDDRIADEPDAVTELVALCGHLPLAIALAAEYVSRFRDNTIAELVDELRDERSRLDVLRDPHDEGTDLRATFSLSYNALRPEAARLFRLLGLVPGPRFDLFTASALDGRPRTRAALDELVAAHLVNQPGRGRFQLHDLLRAYASGLAEDLDPTERRAAIERLAERYVLLAGRARSVLSRPPRLREVVDIDRELDGVPEFDGHGDALRWIERDRDNLVGTVGLAAAHGLDDLAWRLAWLLSGAWLILHNVQEWVSTARIGLACAERLGDGDAIFLSLNNLAMAHTEAADWGEVRACFERALANRRARGDREGEAQVLSNMGAEPFRHGDFEGAVRMYEQALAALPEGGGGLFRAYVLLNLCGSCAEAGRARAALSYGLRALPLFREASERSYEAICLSNLADACVALGDYDEAMVYSDRSLEYFRELGRGRQIGHALVVRGRILHAKGQSDAASEAWREARELLRPLDDRRLPELDALLGDQGSGVGT